MTEVKPFYSGKVRDLYPVDDRSFLMTATDRISAFDVVFPDPVPGKGKLLTSISGLWFAALRNSGLQKELDFEDHVISAEPSDFPEPYKSDSYFHGRSVLVRRTKRVDFECVVRGYLAGSGFKDYTASGSVGGHPLPAGLVMADKLPKNIFTPATKAPLGEHDENVTVAHMEKALGSDLARKLERISLEIFRFASERMDRAGILLCDTKFEFGILDGKIVLIDEALTPDSSRYWEKSSHTPGTAPPGFDKQHLRDYLEETGWNKQPPPPPLPKDVIERTIQVYQEIEGKIRKALG